MDMKQQFQLAYRAEREEANGSQATYWTRAFQHDVGFPALRAAAAAIAGRNHALNTMSTSEKLAAHRQIAELTMAGLFHG